MKRWPAKTDIPDVADFVENDRQWPRKLRLARANTMMQLSKSKNMRDFWRHVLELNKDQ